MTGREVVGRSLQTKLFLIYVSLSLLPIVLLGASASRLANRTARQEMMSVIQQSQLRVTSTIHQNAARIQNVIDTIQADRDILLFASRELDPFTEYQTVSRMRDTVETTLRGMGGSSALAILSDPRLTSEVIIQDYEDRLEIESAQYANIQPEGSLLFAVYHMDRFAEERWFASLGHLGLETRWVRTPTDLQYATLSAVKQLAPSDSATAAIGYVKLTVRLQDLLGEPPRDLGSADYASYLIDSGGSLLAATGTEIDEWERVVEEHGDTINGLEPEVPVLSGESVIVTGGINEQGWIAVGVYSIEEFARRSRAISQQIVFYALLSLLSVAAVTFFVARSFGTRIGRVTKDLERFQLGDHAVRTPRAGSDEIGRLALGFNQMADRIQNLINEVYVAQLTIHREHLAMLQSQINPHFLYNSLSTIVRLAERGEPETIKSMTRSLVDFYRLSLSRGQSLVRFEDELEHVRAYIDVFDIRRRGDFSSEFEIEPDTLAWMVPKVILQPIVENAIEHGMSPDGPELVITIAARVEHDQLISTVRDNGVGMGSEKLEDLRSGVVHATSGYGIRNVTERIKAYYGERGSLEIESAPGAGTLVTMRLGELSDVPIDP